MQVWPGTADLRGWLCNMPEVLLWQALAIYADRHEFDLIPGGVSSNPYAEWENLTGMKLT
jgi:hypothetical protein